MKTKLTTAQRKALNRKLYGKDDYRALGKSITKETTMTIRTPIAKDEADSIWQRLFLLFDDLGLAHRLSYETAPPHHRKSRNHLRDRVPALHRFWKMAYMLNTNPSAIIRSVIESPTGNAEFQSILWNNIEKVIEPPEERGMTSVYLWHALKMNKVPRSKFDLFPKLKNKSLKGVIRYKIYFNNSIPELLMAIEEVRHIQLVRGFTDRKMYSHGDSRWLTR